MPGSSNVVVGVSLRNKNLTPYSVLRIAEVAKQEFSAKRLVFLLADELELVNLRVFDAGSEDALARQITSRCLELEAVIDEGLGMKGYPTQLASSVVRWKDILSQHYWGCYFELFSVFVKNVEFRNALDVATGEFVSRRESEITGAHRLFLSHYVLGELPVLLRGVILKGRRFESMIYPSAGGSGIDEIAKDLASGRYGVSPKFERLCRVKKIPDVLGDVLVGQRRSPLE